MTHHGLPHHRYYRTPKMPRKAFSQTWLGRTIGFILLAAAIYFGCFVWWPHEQEQRALCRERGGTVIPFKNGHWCSGA